MLTLMQAPHTFAHFRDVQPLVATTTEMVTAALQRSPVWERMSSDGLPLHARAAYLEQHWEGLKVLLDALESAGCASDVADALRAHADALGVALDRAHATAQWREHHVTMPSMLEFRRRVAQLAEARNAVGIAAHAVVRLAAANACPSHPRIDAEQNASLPVITVVATEEDEETFSEELSAATFMVLAHGSDVCRSYPVDHNRDASCAMTAAKIRRALR